MLLNISDKMFGMRKQPFVRSNDPDFKTTNLLKFHLRTKKIISNYDVKEKDIKKKGLDFSKVTPNFLKPTISSSAKRVSVKNIDHSGKNRNTPNASNLTRSPTKIPQHEKTVFNAHPKTPVRNKSCSEAQEVKKGTSPNKLVAAIQTSNTAKYGPKGTIVNQTITSKLRTNASLNNLKNAKSPFLNSTVHELGKFRGHTVNSKLELVNKSLRRKTKSSEDSIQVENKQPIKQQSLNEANQPLSISDDDPPLVNIRSEDFSKVHKENKTNIGFEEDNVAFLEQKFYKALAITSESKPADKFKKGGFIEPLPVLNEEEGQIKNEKTQAVIKWLEASSQEQVDEISMGCEQTFSDTSTDIFPRNMPEELKNVKDNILHRVSNLISMSSNPTPILKHNTSKFEKKNTTSASESNLSTNSENEKLPEGITSEDNDAPPGQKAGINIESSGDFKMEYCEQVIPSLYKSQIKEISNNLIPANKEQQKLVKRSVETDTKKPLSRPINYQVKKPLHHGKFEILPKASRKLSQSPFSGIVSSSEKRLRSALASNQTKEKLGTASPMPHSQKTISTKKNVVSFKSVEMDRETYVKQEVSSLKKRLPSKNSDTNKPMSLKKKSTVKKPPNSIFSVSMRSTSIGRKRKAVPRKRTGKGKGLKQGTSSGLIETPSISSRNEQTSLHAIRDGQQKYHSEISLEDHEFTTPKRGTKRPQLTLKAKKKKKKGKKLKKKINLPISDDRNEKVDMFKNQFFLFATFGDRRNSGQTIAMANTVRWLKQAGVIDNKRVTSQDIEAYFIFTTQRRKSLIMREFIRFINVLSTQKGLNCAKVIESMIACGKPNASMTDVAIERMLQLNSDGNYFENPFAEPIFISDSKRMIPIAYKCSESYSQAQKIMNLTEDEGIDQPSENYGIPFSKPPARSQKSEGFIPAVNKSSADSNNSDIKMGTMLTTQSESTIIKEHIPNLPKSVNQVWNQNPQSKKLTKGSPKPKPKALPNPKTTLPRINKSAKKSDISSFESGLEPSHPSMSDRTVDTPKSGTAQKVTVKKKACYSELQRSSNAVKFNVSPKTLNLQREHKELALAGQDILTFFSKEKKMPAKVLLKRKNRPKKNPNVETLVEHVCPSSPASGTFESYEA